MKRLVFGCGYLGERVAQRWLDAGDDVYSVTRNPQRGAELKTQGMHPIIADITAPQTLVELPEADSVLFAVGMDRSTYSDIRDVYVGGLSNVLAVLGDSTNQFIYISSTGVYGDFKGEWIDELDPTAPNREGGKACLEAERLLQASRFGDRATILRFAGIYGPQRVPTRQLIESKQWKKLAAEGYLNLIHVDDGAQIIETISNQPLVAETLNVCDGNPALRREYYEFIALHFGISEIPWDLSAATSENSRSRSNKRVSNRKLVERFGVEFEYNDYKSGLAQAFRATD